MSIARAPRPVIADEVRPLLPYGFDHDPETGECTLLYPRNGADYHGDGGRADSLASRLGGAVGEPTRFYMHVSESLQWRLSPTRWPDTERKITFPDPTWWTTPAHSTGERDRLALFLRQPKYATRKELEDALCTPFHEHRVPPTLRALGHDDTALAIGELAIYRPPGSRPIKDSIRGLLACSIDDEQVERGAPRPPGTRPGSSIGEAVRRQRLREDGPALDDDDDELDEDWLRRERFDVDALEDIGVRWALDNKAIVHLMFVDPCHAHRKRLGREVRGEGDGTKSEGAAIGVGTPYVTAPGRALSTSPTTKELTRR